MVLNNLRLEVTISPHGANELNQRTNDNIDAVCLLESQKAQISPYKNFQESCCVENKKKQISNHSILRLCTSKLHTRRQSIYRRDFHDDFSSLVVVVLAAFLWVCNAMFLEAEQSACELTSWGFQTVPITSILTPIFLTTPSCQRLWSEQFCCLAQLWNTLLLFLTPGLPSSEKLSPASSAGQGHSEMAFEMNCEYRTDILSKQDRKPPPVNRHFVFARCNPFLTQNAVGQ